MADPVLFLPPVIVPRDQVEHREKIRRLTPNQLAKYWSHIETLYWSAQLEQGWKYDQVKEELEDRRGLQSIRD